MNQQEVMRQRRKAVYDVAAQMELDDYRKVSDGVARKIAAQALPRYGRSKSPRPEQVAHVKRWLGDPAKYDPYIDEVAITRACAFEPDVIANLTDDETTEFYDRLAAMADPFDGTLAVSEAGRTGWDVSRMSARYAAWLRLSPLMRNAIEKGVARAKDRLAKVGS